MPTFTLPDPYEGKTLSEMKQRAHELVRALSRWQDIALALASTHGTSPLRTDDAKAVNDLIEAYKD